MSHVKARHMGHWIFARHDPAAIRHAPREAELFKSDQSDEGEYAGTDALVREIVQNSLDARAPGQTVRVRIAICEPDAAPSPHRLGIYFARLREPLKNRGIELRHDGTPDLPCRFLACEDFGTQGLAGDPLLATNPDPSDRRRQDFYWFWRNIGYSGKTGIDLGRWGLGKTVFRAASRVGCMFGMTVRAEDNRRILMGQAVLDYHWHEGVEYVPFGLWSAALNEQQTQVPISDERELNEFFEDWKLTRVAEPGLSVVAPFIHEEIQADLILRAVIVHFFTRILRGELIVDVVGADMGEIRLDAESIEGVCQQVSWETTSRRLKRHVSPPIAFAKLCLAAPPTAMTPLLGLERMPDCSELDAMPEATDLRHRFKDGELTAMRINLWLPRKNKAGREGMVDVYLQRLPQPERCEAYYVREGMTIPKINSRASLRGVRALVIVDSGDLAQLLGDTENPAHEDWMTSAERPTENGWSKWKGRVKFVRGIVDSLVDWLTPPTTEPDFDLLADFFSVVNRQGMRPHPKPGNENRERPVFPTVESRPKWYRISERSGGFSVARETSVPMPPNVNLRLSLAYDIPRGDPLKNWSPFDFDLGTGRGSLKAICRGLTAKTTRRNGNIVYLFLSEEQFQFSLDGFDQNRDLFVRIDEVPDTEELET